MSYVDERLAEIRAAIGEVAPNKSAPKAKAKAIRQRLTSQRKLARSQMKNSLATPDRDVVRLDRFDELAEQLHQEDNELNDP